MVTIKNRKLVQIRFTGSLESQFHSSMSCYTVRLGVLLELEPRRGVCVAFGFLFLCVRHIGKCGGSKESKDAARAACIELFNHKILTFTERRKRHQ